MSYKDHKEIENIFDKKGDQENLDSKFCVKTLMYRFLSEVERITEEKDISRRKLASMVGTSPSFITQLYRGNKIISLDLLAKIEKALDFQFKILAQTQSEKIIEHLITELKDYEYLHNDLKSSSRFRYYSYLNSSIENNEDSMGTKYNSKSAEDFDQIRFKLKVA